MQNLDEMGSPVEFWDYFFKISKIPRCSQNEDQIRNFIKTEAEKCGYSTEIDNPKNLVIRIRPSINNNKKKIRIVLQSHMDMVCEKESNSQHDFSKDPLRLKIIEHHNERWLTADGTTLGADNGVGIAYQLTFMKKIFSGELNFGPLEFDLLFTTSEEYPPFGVTLMDRSLIGGGYLINLDLEEEDKAVIGSAGGIMYKSKVKINRISLNQDEYNLMPIKLSISGLVGGHSGLDIHKGRANAIKLLIQVLWKLNNKYELYINSIDGGASINSIPGASQAIILTKIQDVDGIFNEIKEMITDIKNNFKDIESNLKISIDQLENFKEISVFPEMTKNSLLDLLYVYPSGPISFHPKDKELVLTSTNLGILKSTEDFVEIEFFHRSMSDYELEIIDEKIKLLFRYIDLDSEMIQLAKSPCWTPDYDSNLIIFAKNTFIELYNKDIEILAVHAGCECGEFRQYYLDMEMIAIGATIENVHTPNERLKISSVERIWKFLIALIKNISQSKNKNI